MPDGRKVDDERNMSDEKMVSDELKMSGESAAESSSGSLYNIIVVSTAFMLIFSGYVAASMTMPITVESFNQEFPSQITDAFTALAILYGTFSVSGWIAPSVLRLLGYKISMTIASVTYAAFNVALIHPATWALYSVIGLNGIWGAVLWAGNGAAITENSNSQTISRNSGIFMGMFSSSMVIGNFIVSQIFVGVEKIDQHTRITLYTLLGSVTAVGGATFLLLRPNLSSTAPCTESLQTQATQTSNCRKLTQAFIVALKLIRTTQMIALLLPFFFTGAVMSFYTGVYVACVGFTKRFGADANMLVGQVGIMIGVGKAVSSVGMTMLGRRAARDTFSLLAFLLYIIPFYLIFLYIPNEAPFGPTLTESYAAPNKHVTLVCGFMIGLGDSAITIVIYSLIEALYRNQAGEAHSIFRFAHALGAAVEFLLAGRLLLQWQLLFLSVMCTISVAVLCLTEWKHRRAVIRRKIEFEHVRVDAEEAAETKEDILEEENKLIGDALM